MTDIVERLRGLVAVQEAGGAWVVEATAADVDEAAAEIERLRAALRRIANNSGCCEACPCWAKLRDAAVKALPDAPA